MSEREYDSERGSRPWRVAVLNNNRVLATAAVEWRGSRVSNHQGSHRQPGKRIPLTAIDAARSA
eukprot:4954500-Prymnesium_polylepis.1